MGGGAMRFHPAGATADTTESFRRLISRRFRVSALKSLFRVSDGLQIDTQPIRAG
jgi:hypothetical protein